LKNADQTIKKNFVHAILLRDVYINIDITDVTALRNNTSASFSLVFKF